MNNSITTIDGKFYKKCTVIMRRASVVDKLYPGQLWTHRNNSETTIRLWTVGTWMVKPEELKGYCIPQHLYFLSDEKPVEGDFVFDVHENKYCKLTEFTKRMVAHKKIIATTDPRLIVEKDYGFVGKEYVLPRPSNTFLAKYCDLKGVDEVLVEYNSYCGNIACLEHGCYEICHKLERLKVARDNTITIKPTKDSWNREELIQFAQEAFSAGMSFHNHRLELYSFDKWIERNL